MLLNFVPVNRNVKKNVKPKLVPRKPYIADYSKVECVEARAHDHHVLLAVFTHVGHRIRVTFGIELSLP